jgi:hypothetical protein
MWIAGLIAGCWTGCAPADECNAGDFRCAGSQLQSCFADRAGIPVGSLHYSKGGPNSWISIADCGSAGLCKVAAPVDGGSTPSGEAFCTLDPTPDPVCAATPTDGTMATVCVGATGVTCEEGFAVARYACASCTAGNCEGQVNSVCEGAGECASGLTCREDGYCAATCSCPDGAPCEACGLVDQEAPGSGGEAAPAQWTCQASFCVQE